jgi:hypothetical protein
MLELEVLPTNALGRTGGLRTLRRDRFSWVFALGVGARGIPVDQWHGL